MVLEKIGGVDNSSPWTLRRDDGTPTANPGDFIICDGGTVTLPTPQQGAAVAVGNIEQRTTITASAGQVEFEPEVDIDNPEPAVFVSDGSDWFVANDLDYVGAIPDSGVLKYEYEDDLTDSFNSNNGTEEGTVTFTSSAKIGNQAAEFDAGDAVDTGIQSLTPPFSIGGYVSIANLNDDRAIFGNENGQSDDFQLNYSDGSGAYQVVEGTNTNTFNVSQATGSYAHIVLVHTDTDLILYQDGGDSEGGDEDTLSANSNNTIDNGTNFQFGSSPSGFNFIGRQDDNRIYSKALSSTEVASWFNTGSI